MTYEEAKDILRVAAAEVEWNCPLDYTEAFKKAEEALDKQIPKKPHILHYAPCGPDWEEDWDYACPNCGSEEIDYPDHHCACGQAIDWSDDNGGA